MACKGCLECLLKLLNFILTLLGLAMVGYGIYLFVMYNKSSSSDDSFSKASAGSEMVMLSRPMLIGVSLSSSFSLSKAWFIYVFVAVGVVLFVVSCFGCIGASTRNRCCLSCYAVLVILLILIQLGCAAFIFFDKSWIDAIPTDDTGDFDLIYDFLDENWDIFKWVALGLVIFEAILFILALIVRAANRPAEYDSDDEYIGGGRQQNRQPLINRQPAPATGVPATAASLDQRPSRNDAWSARMREKYGLDTSEFTYNPAGSTQQAAAGTQPQAEEKRCSIM